MKDGSSWGITAWIGGTVLSVFSASATLALCDLAGDPSWFNTVTGVLLGLYIGLHLVPGSVLLSLPLAVVLARKRKEGMSRRALLASALIVGLCLGFVHLAVFLVLESRYGFQPPDGLKVADPMSVIVAIWYGLGLGIGCYLGLPRKEIA